MNDSESLSSLFLFLKLPVFSLSLFFLPSLSLSLSPPALISVNPLICVAYNNTMSDCKRTSSAITSSHISHWLLVAYHRFQFAWTNTKVNFSSPLIHTILLYVKVPWLSFLFYFSSNDFSSLNKCLCDWFICSEIDAEFITAVSCLLLCDSVSVSQSCLWHFGCWVQVRQFHGVEKETSLFFWIHPANVRWHTPCAFYACLFALHTNQVCPQLISGHKLNL